MSRVVKPQVVYLHGLQSSGQSVTVQRLRRTLPHHEVIAPDLPVQPEVAMAELRKLAATLDPDAIVIGTSMGGFFAQMFHGFRRILINPSFHVSRKLKEFVGRRLEFHNPRTDGLKDFEVTDKLVKKYERLEKEQFDPRKGIQGKRKESPELVEGFFGKNDTVVDGRGEFLEHYTRLTEFDGGHRLDPNTTITLLVPRILELSGQKN